MLCLIAAVMNLFACSERANFDVCPVYPVGGEKVAEELENISYAGYEDFWEWMARIHKLKQSLEVCDKNFTQK